MSAQQFTPDGKIPSLRPEPERNRWGQYVLPAPEGGRAAYSRATTVVGALKDLNNLIGWKQRMTAVGLAKRPELADVVLEINDSIELAGKDWKQAKPIKEEMTRVIEQFMHAAGADRGSLAGTEAHTLSEWADAGRLAEVEHLATPEQLADLTAYLYAMESARIERPVEYIERIVINEVIGSAGTYDRLLRLADGRLVVGDLKSQQNLDFGFLEIACQLAQYANAEWMVDGDHLVAMPAELDRSMGIVMHAPVGAGTCELYEVDLEVGWQAAMCARDVRQFRKVSKSLGQRYRPPVAPYTGDDRVLYLIRHAQTRASLEALWRERTAAWTPAMTAAAGRRTAELKDGGLSA
jgi:hypothetical protein